MPWIQKLRTVRYWQTSNLPIQILCCWLKQFTHLRITWGNCLSPFFLLAGFIFLHTKTHLQLFEKIKRCGSSCKHTWTHIVNTQCSFWSSPYIANPHLCLQDLANTSHHFCHLKGTFSRAAMSITVASWEGLAETSSAPSLLRDKWELLPLGRLQNWQWWLPT